MTFMHRLALVVAVALGGACSSGPAGPGTTRAQAGATATTGAPAITRQQRQCQAAGWQAVTLPVAGLQRRLLWQAPASGVWDKGALIVLHGGGGSHTHYCVANVPLIAPQVRFTSQALAAGFAVFLPDSSDQVTDDAGRLCGKVWDDQPGERPNLDLPFIGQLLADLIPRLRPAGSRSEVFITGLSSGGYMATRAASALGERITAFAPVAAGDPYGWRRDCTPRFNDRHNVFGVGLDLETGRRISQPGACSAPASSNQRRWDRSAGGARPPFRQFHHEQDGIHDLSCVEKAAARLVANGFAQTPALRLTASTRQAVLHFWLDDYNQPMLDFFSSFVR